MNVFRVIKDKENPYVMINKTFLNDENLSWKSKGLLAYILSLPDDWQLYECELVKHSKDGKDSLKSAIKELIQQGYIFRGDRVRNEKGHVTGYDYKVFEIPNQDGFSDVGKTCVGKSNVGKPVHTNKITKLNNNNNNIYSNISENDIEEVQKTNKKLELENTIEEIRKFYKGTKSKQKAYTKISSLLKQYSKEELIRSIERYNQYVYRTRKTGFDLKFKNESTFWNGGYIDYLDSNFNTPNIDCNSDKSKIGINTQSDNNSSNIANSIGFTPDWE